MNIIAAVRVAVLALPVLWLLAVLAVSAYAYRLMFDPAIRLTEYTRADGLEKGEFDEAFLELAWENARIVWDGPVALRPGIALHVLPAAAGAGAGAGRTAGTAVFVHGVTWTRYGMLKYARPFAGRGWNLVLVDLPGHGDSPAPSGLFPTYGFLEKYALAAVVDWTRVRFPDGGPFVLVGESMGAATALQYGPLAADKVDAIVADCSYSSARAVLSARLAGRGVPAFLAAPVPALVSALVSRTRGCRLEDVSPEQAAAATAIPVLFIHGGDDSYVPTAMSVSMARAREESKAGPTGLLVVPGARHGKSVLADPAAWFSAVFGFIDEYASRRGPPPAR